MKFTDRLLVNLFQDVNSCLLIPLFNIFGLACLWAFGLAALIFIYAIFKEDPSKGGKVKAIGPFIDVEWENSTRYMFWYFIFGLLWKIAFLGACCQFILASSVCIWYFSKG